MKWDLRELIGNYYKAYVKHFASSDWIDCLFLGTFSKLVSCDWFIVDQY